MAALCRDAAAIGRAGFEGIVLGWDYGGLLARLEWRQDAARHGRRDAQCH